MVPGRSFDECNPVIGDRYDEPVMWKGGDDIGVPADQAKLSSISRDLVPGKLILLCFKQNQIISFDVQRCLACFSKSAPY